MGDKLDKYTKGSPNENTKYFYIDTACFFIHFVWMLLFFREGITLLAILNAVSCMVYLYLYHTISKSRFVTTLFIFYLEVLIHSIMALLCLGFRGGFDLYILLFIPVMFFYSCSQDEGKKLLTAGGIIAGIVYVTLKILTFFIEPRYTFSRTSVEISITAFNSIMCIFSLLFLAYIQCSEVNHARHELEEKNRKLTFLSCHDPMTRLMNRRRMEEIIDRIEDECCKEKCNAIAFFDVDNFKRFNDDYGHECGDLVLIKVAEIIKEGVGLSDVETYKGIFACRWGGEEIVVLFHDCQEDQVIERVTQLKQAIGEYHLIYGECQLSVSVTCGIAYGCGDKGIRDLIKEADAYMLDGKKNGKNCIVMKGSRNA